MINLQEVQLTKALQENIEKKNIIIIGHHPIISAKSNKSENKISVDNNLIKLFKNLKSCFIDKNIYYLCADTHFYQYSQLDINKEFIINQYIVGTGGAEQDGLPLEISKINHEDITYTIIENKKNFGFLEIEINEDIDIDTINLLFNKVESDGGYYKKYIKYKTKYNNLKKMNYII